MDITGPVLNEGVISSQATLPAKNITVMYAPVRTKNAIILTSDLFLPLCNKIGVLSMSLLALALLQSYTSNMNINDFLKLAGEQGKVVVLGEDGSVKGIFLQYEEYLKMSGQKSFDQQKEDIAEKVNREILQAQLEEVMSPSDVAIGNNIILEPLNLDVTNVVPDEPIEFSSNAERIDSLLNKRAQNLFKSIPYNYSVPEVATSASDEEIKPNFDDI